MGPTIEFIQHMDINNNHNDVDVLVKDNEQIMMNTTTLASSELFMSHQPQNALRDCHGLITIPASCLSLDLVNDGVLLVPADDKYESDGMMKNAALLLKMKSMHGGDTTSHHRMGVSGSNNLSYQRRKSSLLTIIKPPMENIRSSHGSTTSLTSIVDYFVGRSAH